MTVTHNGRVECTGIWKKSQFFTTVSLVSENMQAIAILTTAKQ